MNGKENTALAWAAAHRKIIVKGVIALVVFAVAVGVYADKRRAREDAFVIDAGGGAGTAVAGADADETAVAESPAPAPIVVDVSGAVNAPTVLILPDGSRVYEAIASAGGLSPDADMREINRAATLRDGDRLYIPTTAEVASSLSVPASAGRTTVSPGVSGASGSGSGNAPASDIVNINTADAAGLQRLSGVGPSTAQKILDYREKNGPFEKPEDLKKVSGIGEKTFEKLRDHIGV